MAYLVYDHTKRGKVFATLEEAAAYREEIARRLRRIYTITETTRKVTHTYKI